MSGDVHINDIEPIEVDVPVNGLRVTLDHGRFTKFFSVHAETDPPNVVRVTQCDCGTASDGFCLTVYEHQPIERKPIVIPVKDVDGVVRMIPSEGTTQADPILVAAKVRYKVYGE